MHIYLKQSWDDDDDDYDFDDSDDDDDDADDDQSLKTLTVPNYLGERDRTPAHPTFIAVNIVELQYQHQ